MSASFTFSAVTTTNTSSQIKKHAVIGFADGG
jgi:hypothetical protein